MPRLGAASQPVADPARRHVPIDDAAEDDALAVVTRFFEAFARRDAAAMAACYHPMASYSSPVFPDLRGVLPGAMWALALSDAQALQLQWSVAFADARKAQVTWRASWRGGRRLRRLEAASTIAVWDGGIVRQVDEFRFARWAAQALGVWSWPLAWLAPFQRRVRQRARAALEAFMGAQPARNA